MPISLHPDARRHFDDLGETLLAQLSAAPPPPAMRSAWSDKLHVTATVDLGDVHDGSWLENPDLKRGKGSSLSGTGPEMAGSMGRCLCRSQRACQRYPPRWLSALVTLPFVKEQIVTWLRARHSRQKEISLSESLLAGVDSAVAFDPTRPIVFRRPYRHSECY